MSIFLGSSQIQGLLGSIASAASGASAFSTPAPPISGAAIALNAGLYNNSSTWENYNGNVSVLNPGLVGKLGNGFWQFDGNFDSIALVNGLSSNGLINTGSNTQSFTMMFYGSLGSLASNRALFGSPSYVTTPSGSDAIFRIDTSPPSGYCHLDLRRGPLGSPTAVNRFSIPYSSGSTVNFGITYDGATTSASLYVDGVLTATSSSFNGDKYTPWYNNGGNGPVFGNNDNIDAAPFNGGLGGFYVYNRILTGTEISQSAAWFSQGNTVIPAQVSGIQDINSAYLGNNLVYAKPTTTTTTTTTSTSTTTTTTTTTTTAAPSIPTNGLQLYLNPATSSSWPTSGSTLYDLSGNGRNFQLVGSPSFTGSNSFGFNGSSNYMSSSNAGLNILSATSSFSIYTFFKPSTTGTVSGVQQVMSKNQSSPNYMGWAIGYNGYTGGSEGRWGLDMLGAGGGSERIAVDTTNAYTSSRFVGNCITYNGNANASGVKLYFNAVSGAVATSVRNNTWTTATNPQTTAPTNIAGRDNSTNLFSGRVGAVLIYNRELSSTEVTTIYNLLSASFTN